MNETKIVWHPYPKEKPKKRGRYFVTWITPIGRQIWVTVLKFDSKNKKFELEDSTHQVIAWSELPLPYRQEAKDE